MSAGFLMAAGINPAASVYLFKRVTGETKTARGRGAGFYL